MSWIVGWIRRLRAGRDVVKEAETATRRDADVQEALDRWGD